MLKKWRKFYKNIFNFGVDFFINLCYNLSNMTGKNIFKTKSKLPKFLENYFWDVDFKRLDIKKYPSFIAERILEYGDKKDFKWLENTFSKKFLKKIVLESRILTYRSANFWSIIFNFNKKEISCLKKSLQKRQNKIWSY